MACTTHVFFRSRANWNHSQADPARYFCAYRNPQALPEGEIVRLAGLGSKVGGTKDIGKYLGALKLPGPVLEDTYLRIAMEQGTITRVEAEGMMARLYDVPGFRSTLSKIVGASDVKTKGHLHELKLSDSAAEHGFKVEGIGASFRDVNKAGVTDIDVILTRNGKTVAIEAKDYSSSTQLPMDSFRADMVTLNEYEKVNFSSRVIKIFSMTNRPLGMCTLRPCYRRKQNVVELVSFTDHLEEQVRQIRQLEKLL